MKMPYIKNGEDVNLSFCLSPGVFSLDFGSQLPTKEQVCQRVDVAMRYTTCVKKSPLRFRGNDDV